jgi:hypothetical protein
VDLAPVDLHEALHRCQTQAMSGYPVVVSPMERGEEPAQLVLGNAGSIVLDIDRHSAALNAPGD